MNKKFNHLLPSEREQFAILQAQGCSVGVIASRTGRHRSTVYRELSRNTAPEGQYLPLLAQESAARRKAAAGRREPLKNAFLRSYVAIKMALRWSPERISGRLSKEHPGLFGLNASTEAIYQI